MDIVSKISQLDLPENSYIVVGSGILGARGIRISNDIDLVVAENVYVHFNELGWKHGKWSDQTVLQHDVFEIGQSWYGKKVNELLETAEYVNGIPYLSLEDVYIWKKKLGREKDLRDVKLIEEYNANFSR